MVDLEARYRHYAARMKQFMQDRNITGEMGGEMIGAHPTTIYDLWRGDQKLDDEWREKVARGLKVEHDVLFGSRPLPRPAPAEVFKARKRGRKPKHANDNIPHYGLAAGSVVGAHSMSNDLPEEVPCPPSLRDVLGAYALTTTGESMKPRFFPKERLFVNPHQAVRPGDHVVIQTQNDDGTETTTWVKRYDGEDAEWVWAWQYNPEARVQFKKAQVRYIHRILTTNELF